MTVVIGVDPGISGAISCFIDGELLDVVDMPVADGCVVAALLRSQLVEYSIAGFDDRPLVIVEKVGAMPGNGSVSMFKFGRSLGVIEGVVGGLAWPISWVRPQEWKKGTGLIGKDKDAARLLAIETWPEHAQTFARKKDCGRADAALIGAWNG
jgi:crossover junction endodeoxyribonuclease RuvC